MLKSLERRLAGPLDPIALSRRGFLIGATAVGSSLVIGYASAAETPPGAAAAINPFDGYVKIDPDNRITVYSAHMDMGQGIYFGVATLVQDELDADWAKLDVVGGWGNVPLYNNIAFGGKMEGTGGSTGSFASWDRYRKAGATAREMLIAAAAAAWNVPAKDIAARKGVLEPRERKIRDLWRDGRSSSKTAGAAGHRAEREEGPDLHRRRRAAALRIRSRSRPASRTSPSTCACPICSQP